jgi:ubiquinone/menaquinone biosynthesis C-methylase UbiE
MNMKELIENHWTSSAGTYNRWVRNNIQSSPVRNLWMRRLRSVLGEKPLDILDVGTGPGVMAFFMTQLGHRVTGIDLSQGMIEQARGNARWLGLDVTFEQADAERLPFPDGRFDVVFNRIVLWTMPSPERAIQEWTRVLKPRGRLVIVDGNGAKLRKTLKHNVWKWASAPLVMLTELRNPLGHRQDYWDALPMTHRSRPQWEVAHLRSIGYQSVRTEIIGRRELGLLEYLKHGCWGDYFLVSGIRGES